MFTAVFELKNLNILLPLYLFCNVEEKCHFASTVRHKERPIILSGKIFSRISAFAFNNNTLPICIFCGCFNARSYRLYGVKFIYFTNTHNSGLYSQAQGQTRPERVHRSTEGQKSPEGQNTEIVKIPRDWAIQSSL